MDFAVYELGLFLDTHPNERRALEDHNKYARRAQQLKATYEENLALYASTQYQGFSI